MSISIVGGGDVGWRMSRDDKRTAIRCLVKVIIPKRMKSGYGVEYHAHRKQDEQLMTVFLINECNNSANGFEKRVVVFAMSQSAFRPIWLKTPEVC